MERDRQADFWQLNAYMKSSTDACVLFIAFDEPVDAVPVD
jgi:hypothetical protein